MKKKCIMCGAEIDVSASNCMFCMAVQPHAKKAEKEICEKKNEDFRKRRKKQVVVKPSVSIEQAPHIDRAAQSAKDKKRAEQEKKDKLKELEYKANHDNVTGLFNRQAYEERLQSVSQNELAVVSIDANNLKKTNDEYGHLYGDILLQSITSSMIAAFGEENCYRTGGDEFSAILEGVRDKIMEGKLATFYEEMKKAQIELPESEKFEISAAVGVAYGDGMHTIKEICDAADKEMYRNKRKMKDSADIKKKEIEKPSSGDKDGFSIEYDCNEDGYYNDLEPMIDEEEVELNRDMLLKAIVLVVGSITAVVALEIFFNLML